MAKTNSERQLPTGITYRESKKLYMWRFKHNNVSYCGYCKTLADAKKELRNKRYEVEHGKYRKEANDTLDEWFEEWLEVYKHCKDSSLKTYTMNYKGIISPVFGKVKLKSIKKEQMQKFVNQTAEKYSRSTAQACIHLLFECLERARKNGKINRNPMEDIETPRYNKPEKKRALTAEQEQQFFDFVKSTGCNYYSIYRTMALTGMRIGEVLGLSWENVDFDRGEIRVYQNLCYTPKNGLYLDTPKSDTSIRRLPMKKGSELFELLKKRRIEQFEQRASACELWQPVDGFEDLVFTTENGKPHYDSNVRSKMHRIVTKMQKLGYDLPDFTPHTLRHSFATRCLENGMNPKTLQRVLGHSTFAITMDTYCDVMDNTIDAEMELVARAL